MERVIKIDLYDKKDLTEKYNENQVSKSLIHYMVEELMFINNDDTVKVIIHNKCNLDNECFKIIKKGLEIEYQNNLRNRRLNNIKQFILLMIGVSFLCLNMIIKDGFIFKELFLVASWVAIWEVVDIELFTDVKERRKRKVLKKLLESDIIIDETN